MENNVCNAFLFSKYHTIRQSANPHAVKNSVMTTFQGRRLSRRQDGGSAAAKAAAPKAAAKAAA